MPPKRFGVPHTFPHKIVFIISLVLCMCACGSIVNAVIAWSNLLWGYYLGTGFWSGAVILLAGMFGIVASYVRSICAVKTFMIISIFGCIVSLGMIALAAGGLDPQSGFYHGFNKTIFMTHVVHAVYLGLGVLQVALCVLSDGICIYYLFIERNAELYSVKNGDTNRRKHKGGKIRRYGKDRSSTGSQVPLVGESKSSRRKSKDQNDGKVKLNTPEAADENTEVNEFFPIPYTGTGLLDRETLLRQEILMSKVSPLRITPYNRSSSFSTFGRIGAPDRESLIVHPTDDNASVADTVTSNPQSPDDECHYAQTMLFGPPLPIEEDETLPPYEVIDNTPRRTKPIKPKRSLKRPKSEELHVSGKQSRRNASVQEREKRGSSKRNRSSQNRGNIPAGRNDDVFESGSLKRSSKAGDGSAALRLSKSADLLSFDDEHETGRKSQGNVAIDNQGVTVRDFTHSSETIRVLGQPVQLRHKRPQSQTMRVNRDKRLDRRRKALSAEVKLNKDRSLSQEGILSNESDNENRTGSLYGSNPSLFASNRIRSTKFSLRTPVRQIGMPHVCSPVPVKPLVTVPRVSPPPKPPRNYSVTADDLKDLELDTDKEVEQVLADINDLNYNADNEDDVFTEQGVSAFKPEKGSIESEHMRTVADTQIPRTFQTENEITPTNVTVERNTFNSPLSPEIKLDAGPVLKFVPPTRETKSHFDTVDGKQSGISKRSGPFSISENNYVKPIQQAPNTMVLPTSPVLKRPPDGAFVSNKVNDVRKPSNENVTTWDKNKFDSSSGKHKMPNNTEVVYAKVRKESQTSLISPTSSISPASPSSPTSPTSPSARVLKAKRLTYTFKDKDVSVFDPIGNTTEAEETNELVQTVAVKYPVDVKENSHTETPSYKIDSPTNMVRMPPLSPSERILQRKASRELSPSKEDRPVILQPANLTVDTSGARPKTSFKGLFTPLSPPKQTRENTTDIRQPDQTHHGKGKALNGTVNHLEANQQNLSKPKPPRSSSKNSVLPPKAPKPTNKPVARSTKPPYSAQSNSVYIYPVVTTTDAINTTTNATRNAPTNRTSLNITTNAPISRTSTQSTRAVPINRASTTGNRDIPVNRGHANSAGSQSVSQGVLRLPHSQYSRQVSDNVARPNFNVPGAVNRPQNANVMAQNNAQQNTDNSPNSPLFSLVL